jgi:hypothetical protein
LPDILLNEICVSPENKSSLVFHQILIDQVKKSLYVETLLFVNAEIIGFCLSEIVKFGFKSSLNHHTSE